jgi:hypothetical protein
VVIIAATLLKHANELVKQNVSALPLLLLLLLLLPRLPPVLSVAHENMQFIYSRRGLGRLTSKLFA